MEDLVIDSTFWTGRRVFLTGHTGFKGSWLALWLSNMGAQVHGYALAPLKPGVFESARLDEVIAGHTVGDLRDTARLSECLQEVQPEVVFHLAAQPLVRYSYREPVETYMVNVMGTVHLLEAVRTCESVRVVVNITTDKCYENREWVWGYRECEPMGGRDPYSSSKACAELVTAAYRDSFFEKRGLSVATARAGNVIGGGDWGTDRLLPDFFRANRNGQELGVRYPEATRPWQHVLEPLCGYLILAQHLHASSGEFSEGWNFGPSDEDAKTVRWILTRMTELMPGTRWRQLESNLLHEAGYLKLDSSKARSRLRWRPKWGITTALRKTVEWYEAEFAGADMQAFCLKQIAEHRAG